MVVGDNGAPILLIDWEEEKDPTEVEEGVAGFRGKEKGDTSGDKHHDNTTRF